MINDVERRTRFSSIACLSQSLVSTESGDSCSSCFVSSQEHSTEDKTWEDCQGTQPYLFEPYDSEASSDTDFTNKSDEEQFERPQNTEW